LFAKNLSYGTYMLYETALILTS